MTNTHTRYGNFTSSEIWKLMTNDRKGEGFGAPALTYIKEKITEAKLGRSLNEYVFSKPTSWGLTIEQRVFELLGLEYQIVSKDRIVHPTIERWSGMPDIITDTVVGDIKCLWLKSFTEIYEIKDSETLKAEYPNYYWQLVSNSILTGLNTAELVVYCPYKSELDAIRELGAENDINWIKFATDSELPHLIDGGYYKNIHKIVFEVSEEDKALLTKRVEMAVEMLNNQINK